MNLEQSSTTILRTKPALADRFEVIEVLGEGASGAVYRVRDREQGGREVALKILLNNAAFDENTLARFVAEFRILQKLNHPNLVESYDLIEVGETIAFTMEYVPGSDLGHVFRTRKLSHEEIDQIFYQILSALHEIHQQGVIHRDIKLENILLTRDGRVKLSDLGLMKCGEFEAKTKTGILLGTAQYMPPEYVRNSMYDQRGDLYAVGLMLYEMLTSKRRLCDKTGNEALEYLIKTRFEVPRITLTGLPRKYLNIIDRALDPDPELRFQSALSMREAFVSMDPEVSIHIEIPERNVEAHRFCEISAMSEGLVRGRSRSSGTLARLLAVALTLGAVGGGYFYWMMSADDLVLASGYYEGTLNVDGSLNRVELFVSGDGIQFSSALESCSEGAVDLQSGKIACNQEGMQLRIEAATAESVRGSVLNVPGRASHRFTADRKGDLPAKPAVEKKAKDKK